MELLSRLHSRSREAKARYAFIGASILTGIIALVWMSTLPGRFADVGGVTTETEGATDLRELWGDTTEQLGNVIRSTEEASIELNNLNNLNNLSIEQEEAPVEGVEEAPAPTAKQEEKTEEKDEEVREPSTPRVILIGTTTSME